VCMCIYIYIYKLSSFQINIFLLLLFWHQQKNTFCFPFHNNKKEYIYIILLSYCELSTVVNRFQVVIYLSCAGRVMDEPSPFLTHTDTPIIASTIAPRGDYPDSVMGCATPRSACLLVTLWAGGGFCSHRVWYASAFLEG